MDPEEKMNFTERRKYLSVMYRRYQKASPKERSALLDEMEAVTRLHRKSLIRLMQRPVATVRKPRKKERGPVYSPPVRDAISLIARALDYPAAERLQPMLTEMASLLAQQGLLEADDALLTQLATISISTVPDNLTFPITSDLLPKHERLLRQLRDTAVVISDDVGTDGVAERTNPLRR